MTSSNAPPSPVYTEEKLHYKVLKKQNAMEQNIKKASDLVNTRNQLLQCPYSFCYSFSSQLEQNQENYKQPNVMNIYFSETSTIYIHNNQSEDSPEFFYSVTLT